MFSEPLISAADACALLDEPDVRFIDATWYMPNVPSDAYGAYLQERIPGAVYFDIDQIADASVELPHVFPSLATFEQSVGQLGLSADSRIIVYDRGSFVASARVWWMFRAFGHPRVSALDGGLEAWKRAGGKLTASGERQVTPQKYIGRLQDNAVIMREEVAASLSDRSVALIDARSPGRFNATEPEPRPGLRGGHIPGSVNLYYGDLLNEDGTMKSSDSISALLSSLSVRADQQIVTTCGSGVTAAILLLGIFQLRQSGLRLYDGSWTEWALHPDSPITC